MSVARVPVALCFVVVALLAGDAPSQARRRDLVVVTSRTPRHRHAGRPAAGVRIVDGSTTEVIAAEPDTRLRLRRIPGFVGFAVATRCDGDGGIDDVSRIFRHVPRRVTRLRLRPRAAGLDGGGTVGMGDVPLGLPDGSSGNAAGALLGRLFPDTRADGVRWVDETSGVRDARRRELDLQEQGLTDPATHISDTPLAPDLHVDGDLTVSDGRVTGEMRITDDATGEVTRIPIDEPLDDGDWPDVVRRIVERVRPRLIERLRQRPTTTTSTTSTTTTTASTITSSSTITTTTNLPTSSTTAPSTTSTTSTSTSTTASTMPVECTTSAECGPTACCNVAHRCCDLAHPDDGCDAGGGFDSILSCSYLVAGAPPTALHGECGPQTPPECPWDAVVPKSFSCAQCSDTAKYVEFLQ